MHTFSIGNTEWLVSDIIEQTERFPADRIKLEEVREYVMDEVTTPAGIWEASHDEPLSWVDFLWHVERIMASDLRYPILIDKKIGIIDGYHRLSKAIITGKESILVRYITLFDIQPHSKAGKKLRRKK